MKPRFALPALALIAALVCGAMAQDAEPDADTAPRANAARKPHAPLVINDDTIGMLRQHQVGSIILPDGKPPFAAVIVLHGCNGVSPNTRVWARRIASWGYAALIVDSFSARGLAQVCDGSRALPGFERAKDVFAAASYLRSRPNIDGGRIAVFARRLDPRLTPPRKSASRRQAGRRSAPSSRSIRSAHAQAQPGARHRRADLHR